MSFARLQPHLNTRAKILVSRNRPSNPRISGYLLGLSEELALLHAFDDFEPDGYTIVRTADVVDVRSGPYERHWDRMLAGEGLLGGLDEAPALSLTDMRATLRAIQALELPLIVQCEDADSAIEDFYIGEIVGVEDTTLRFDHFDALGAWTLEPDAIELDEITMLQLATPYMRRFWRYLAPRGTPRAGDLATRAAAIREAIENARRAIEPASEP